VHPAKASFGLLLIAAAVTACSPATSPITSPVSGAGSPSPLSSVLSATGAPTTSATTAAPTAKSTVGPPAAPTSVAMTSLTPPSTCPAAFGSSCFKYKVDWTEAGPSGVTIDIFAVTKCLDHPDCVLATTTIPATNLVLLTSVAASKKTTTFILGDGESNGAGWLPGSGSNTEYVYGVVVRARNASGKSGIVVAWAW
jgi:hypothetical protein